MSSADSFDAPAPFAGLNKAAEKSLQRLASLALKQRPGAEHCKTWSIFPLEVEQHDSPLRLIKAVEDWAGRGWKFLYAIQIVSAFDFHKLKNDFNSAKKAGQGDGRKFSRLNNDHSETSWLYVGRSEKLHTRLKEHLGYGAKSTYSLQMSHWANPLTFQLRLHCSKYRSDIDDDVLQALEDQLWNDLKPMFGRRGPR